MIAKTMDMSILYVEDDKAVREGMHEFLGRRFDQIFLAENGAAGLDAYRINAPDIVMTDINMPVMDGLDMIRAILEQNDKAAIIVTSAYNEAVYLLGAIELGVSHYLMKPLDRDKLDASLKHCIEIVQKTRTLNERENTTNAFYQTINTLLDCGEKNITNAICLDSELERQLDQMIENILGCGVATTSHSPASLIMTLTHGLTGQPQWLWYEMEKDRSLQKACYLDHPKLNLDAPVGSHALFFVNDGEPLPDDPLLRLFVEHFDRHGKKLRNLIWYRNGSRIIFALDYPAPVTAGDAVVIKNLAMQIRFLDTISAEHHQTEEAFLYTITSLARAAEVNDEDTGNHILRVGQYCAAICRQIGYPDTMAKIIEQQSRLHDVGKIHISAEILKKPGKLADDEMSLMREHPVLGARIIGMHPRLEIARSIALHHHEHWDGSGYPYGLRGTAIPLDARIVAIADTYDALRNRRSYKPPFDHDTARRIIVEGDGRSNPSHFAPDILAIFKKNGEELDEIYERLATVE
ncbi:MAG TPA: response regulator [Desulfuromonadales bacterium]|nr:response regulator [Desulfuromonadales bacterium]